MDLTELADRALVADVLHAYCDRVDRSDVGALLDLFTEDAVLDMGRGATATGRADLRPFMIERIGRWTTTHHQCSTITLTSYDGRRASAVSYVSVFHDHPGRDEALQLWGRYEDDLVKDDFVGAGGGSVGDGGVGGGVRWRIAVRRFRVAGVRRTTSDPLPDRFERLARLPLPDA